MFYHVRLPHNYRLISTYQMSQDKKDEALVSLEKKCYHAVEYDKSYINNQTGNTQGVIRMEAD